MPADSISWSPKNIAIHPHIKVETGKRYQILLKSATIKGCYGIEFSNNENGAVSSSGKGNYFIVENKMLKCQVFIE